MSNNGFFCSYQELAAEGLRPTRVTFNTLLKACMRAKDAARADEVLTWMQERSCQVCTALSGRKINLL